MKEEAHKIVWKNCLDFIKDNIRPQAFKTWFEPIVAVKLEKDILKLEVPSKFFYEWLEEHYVKILRMALIKELGEKAKLIYVIRMENKNGSNKAPYTVQLPGANKNPVPTQNVNTHFKIKDNNVLNPFIIPGINKIRVESQLNPNYTFDNFMEGDSNRLPRSAGKAVAEKPGETSFNPLFIYGGVGLGKTHMANAIGLYCKEKNPEKTILYVTAEKFTQQFIDSIRNNTRNDFIHFYQMIDVLIVDDVQFLSGKEKTQDVLFHIFNHLHQNHKQVILTSDKAPVDMHDIEIRLLSRFKWGLSAEILPPDYNLRVNILKNKMFSDGVSMPDEVIEYVAHNIKNNVRELEGTLISLVAHASFTKQNITLELASDIVEKFSKKVAKDLSIDYIQKTVADYFDINLDVLQSKTRKRHIVQARQLAMFFSKKLTKSSLANIGSQIGKRDHATVLHACRTVENLSDTDKQFRKYVEELNKRLTV